MKNMKLTLREAVNLLKHKLSQPSFEKAIGGRRYYDELLLVVTAVERYLRDKLDDIALVSRERNH